MKITDAQTLPYETLAHAFATKPGLGIDIDENALTRKPFSWRPALVLRHMWKTNPLLQKPTH